MSGVPHDNSAGIPDISPVEGLQPKKMFIPEVGEDCVNMDGVIAIMKQIDTPEAKAMYRAFRRHYAEMRLSRPGETAQKVRQAAVLAAIKDCGHRINFTPISGEV
jgi:hypothetical protein